MLGCRPLAVIEASQCLERLRLVGCVVEHRADGGNRLVHIVEFDFQNGNHAVAQPIPRCRLDRVCPAAQKLHAFTRLARFLEDAFQVLKSRIRRFTLAVEQAAVGGHRRREIVQGVLLQTSDTKTKSVLLAMILGPFTPAAQHIDQTLDVRRLEVERLQRRRGRRAGSRVADVQVEDTPPCANGRAAIRQRTLEEPGRAREQVGDSGDVRGVALAREILVERLQIAPASQSTRQSLGLHQGRLGLWVTRQHRTPCVPGSRRCLQLLLLHLGLAHQQGNRRRPLLPLALDVEDLHQTCPVFCGRIQRFQHHGCAPPLFRILEHPFDHRGRPSIPRRQFQGFGQQIERRTRIVEADECELGPAQFQLRQLLARHEIGLMDEKVIQIPPALGRRVISFQHTTRAQVRRIQLHDPAQHLGRVVAVIQQRLVDLDRLPQQGQPLLHVGQVPLARLDQIAQGPPALTVPHQPRQRAIGPHMQRI